MKNKSFRLIPLPVGWETNVFQPKKKKHIYSIKIKRRPTTIELEIKKEENWLGKFQVEIPRSCCDGGVTRSVFRSIGGLCCEQLYLNETRSVIISLFDQEYIEIFKK